ncbi:MAG: hypothetical protein MPEBLZ_01056 [Candidatus Methanoperedens nitroreducens]|uniref:Uncharacterized protein n=1 Tax=Candidatus Methanoperedens nitratireducens TaxID=1392998 RepID=A0A0P8AIM0_9EURY|nr:response regulator [Candidatus Methanoperedens sp. BLZ2]KAB2944401.1 MAG: response regulator [Candidatus Methanoperedens sp.]KPQ44423.1 MAG: hypothetical protein MPEBLZ_01056 [Candidatus Methanoperedens sp. BLZ1]MBZ0174962.1 response regulator [Candidatus Methanoperedens nitroreducens]MCX9079796.1 response regulator [Candidatus Methanoperedens sp.]
MKIKTIYIDDEDEELRKYQRIFENDVRAKNQFEIIAANSQKQIGDLINEVKNEKPELILVDLDLTIPKEGLLLGVSGAALSTALREEFPEVPIILFTKTDFLKIQKVNPKVLSSLDETIYKSDLFKGDANLDCLDKLANGYKQLRNEKSKTWIELLEIIEAPKNDYDSLKVSDPPTISENVWSVFDAAYWIRNTLIKYPGILYDPIHSAAFLGLSRDAFLSESVQKLFSEAKYSKIFVPIEGRWWKSRLQEIAESIMDEKEKDLIIREGFPLAWDRINKTNIDRSKCVFCGKEPAEWVCHILKKPVMIKCSLRYKPDSRPSVMDEARVSYNAIRTSNEVNDEKFDPIEYDMLPNIRKK